jgi:hypothetical protein
VGLVSSFGQLAKSATAAFLANTQNGPKQLANLTEMKLF